jgi:LmbE family N-acetylglucosaminyl deacetylase
MLDWIENWKRVLVFGAHVDDELIGPGGTLARLSQAGAQVHVVTFTGGDADTGYARPEWKGKVGALRREEAGRIDAILGIHQRTFLGYPTQNVPNDVGAYQQCVGLIRQFRPQAIFTHWIEDKHRDHRAVAALTDEARWKAAEHLMPELGQPWHTPQLFFYEIMELFPHPSLLVDISTVLPLKLDAMQAATTQLEVLPGIRNYIQGLALARGYGRGVQYAEAFLASNLLPGLA